MHQRQWGWARKCNDDETRVEECALYPSVAMTTVAMAASCGFCILNVAAAALFNAVHKSRNAATVPTLSGFSYKNNAIQYYGYPMGVFTFRSSYFTFHVLMFILHRSTSKFTTLQYSIPQITQLHTAYFNPSQFTYISIPT